MSRPNLARISPAVAASGRVGGLGERERHGRDLTFRDISQFCPTACGYAGAHLGYTSDVVELVERYLYQPLPKPFMTIVRAAKRMQNGRPDAYVGYVLIAFIAVLAVVVALP